MKKGFTLIELLAVIIVIAVVTLITVPIISGVMTKVKVQALKDSGYGMLEAANLYRAQYGTSKTIRFDIDNNVIKSDDTNDLIKYTGEIKSGTILINKQGEVTICLSDGQNSVYKNYSDKEIKESPNGKCDIPETTCKVYLNGERTEEDLCGKEVSDKIKELEHKLDTISTITIDRVYPVGSIYTSTEDDTVAKVEERFGGTWEVYGQGKTLVGVDANQAEFNIANKTGGQANTTLAVGNLPAHNHSIPALSGTAASNGAHTHSIPALSGTAASNGAHTHSVSGTANTGGDWSFFLDALGDRVGITALTNAVSNVYTFKSTAPVYKISSNSYTSNFDATDGIGHSGHTHSVSGTAASNGAHTHSVTTTASTTGSSGAHTHSVTTNASTTGSQGSGTSFTNMPPYITVYMYKRIS